MITNEPFNIPITNGYFKQFYIDQIRKIYIFIITNFRYK
jgi:hypothetical protein